MAHNQHRMTIFKFGGASVKDADSVKNVAAVLRSQGFDSCLLVVSAMGKTTNALEEVVKSYFAGADYSSGLEGVRQYHKNIAGSLFAENHPVFNTIEERITKINHFLAFNKSRDFNFIYDQTVSVGELLSSKLLSEYLREQGFHHEFLDARNFIRTDSTFRDAAVDWQISEEKIRAIDKSKSYVTQGFIGSNSEGRTVTLGREGSDYSAAIFAYCTDADSVTIWKDVPGVMTGDPRKFPNATLLSNISYEEAIEMAYYGASVIHPKTLQPLLKKQIPFHVKSFLKPWEAGTYIGFSTHNEYHESYVLKENQWLMRIATRDFSFIAEEHLSQIFRLVSRHQIKVSLMQNSAISLAICLEDKFQNIEALQADLRKAFDIEVTGAVSLFTVRNFNPENLPDFFKDKEILLEQISTRTLQRVIR